MTGQAATTEQPGKRGWFQRLREGMSRTSSKLATGIGDIFTKRKLDDAALQELEELLIAADLGPATAARLTANLAKTRFNQEVSAEEVRGALARDIADILKPVAKPLAPDPEHRPHVILVVGVNGTGKTTTIGKLAARLREDGHRVMLAAGDTFRAAAIEQLKIWGERTGAAVVARETGADAAGLAFDALKEAQTNGSDVLLIDTAGRLQNKQGLMDELAKAKAEGFDVLLIDTAGRLHNKANLMAELQKVIRVLRKQDPAAPQD
ncbi:MAG TPA: signaling recognition particle receptor family protein, partial [Dongiaceae bacterium]